MPTEIIEKKSRKNQLRPLQVDYRVTWPDELTEDNDFLLEYINRDPLVKNARWQAIGNYSSKKQAREAAVADAGSDIKDVDWEET